jgi:hypothetical protein
LQSTVSDKSFLDVYKKPEMGKRKTRRMSVSRAFLLITNLSKFILTKNKQFNQEQTNKTNNQAHTEFGNNGRNTWKKMMKSIYIVRKNATRNQ